jgi:hypothetical protein
MGLTRYTSSSARDQTSIFLQRILDQLKLWLPEVVAKLRQISPVALDGRALVSDN